MESLGSFPRVLNVLPREKIAAPRVFGLWSGLGCGLGLVFRKSLGGPSIFSLGSTLSTLGKLPRGSIHHATSSAFPQIVPDMFVPVSLLDDQSVNFLKGGEKAMAFSLRRRPSQKYEPSLLLFLLTA